MVATQNLLNQAVQRLTGRFTLQKIILFGSAARGTAGPQSDIDLLVICSLPDAGHERRELTTQMYRALRGLKVGSDLVVMTPQEFEIERQLPGSVAKPASQEGKVLYERTA